MATNNDNWTVGARHLARPTKKVSLTRRQRLLCLA